MHLPRTVRLCFSAAVWLLFVFCADMARAQEPESIPYDHNVAVGKFYDINGFKMYTEVYGSGPPLLMIHGNNGDATLTVDLSSGNPIPQAGLIFDGGQGNEKLVLRGGSAVRMSYTATGPGASTQAASSCP